MIPYKHTVTFSRLAILQLMLLCSNSDILVKSKVLPSQWSTFVHYQLSARIEQSVCIPLEGGLREETHGRKTKSDALAWRNGMYIWTTAKWKVKKSLNLSYPIRPTSKCR